jgi:hypothetical protein
MRYVNVGVSLGGTRIPTKADLRRAVTSDPADVSFDATSIVGGRDAKWSGRATEIPEDITLSVCGPDPYQNRQWWATVTRKGDKVTVK